MFFLKISPLNYSKLMKSLVDDPDVEIDYIVLDIVIWWNLKC